MYHKSTIESSVALGNQRFPRSRAFCKCTPCPVTESASKLAFGHSPWAALSKRFRGDNEIRTRDLLLARQALSQLSYTPIMGLSGLEPPTSRLSGVRSNRLSYKPIFPICKPLARYCFYKAASTCSPVPSPVKYHRPPVS